MNNFSQSKNKFGYIYVLTPQGQANKAALKVRFLQCKLAEYQPLQAEVNQEPAPAMAPAKP